MKLIDVRSPAYVADSSQWATWREALNAGPSYIRNQLQKLPEEDYPTYLEREKLTPHPAYIKACLREILTGIFTQMGSVIRRNGPKTFQTALTGNIDGAGTSLNYFLVMDVLRELLTMKRVAICVDRAVLPPEPTVADAIVNPPYLYIIEAENILAWHTPAGASIPTEVLIKDINPKYFAGTSLRIGGEVQYRYLRKMPGSGVAVTYYDEKGNEQFQAVLDLQEVPIIILETDDSIIQDVIGHQAAILNLMSSTIAYAIGANMSVYTEQSDMATLMASLRAPVLEEGDEPTEAASKLKIGKNYGRRYSQNSDRPDFISPDTENIPKMLELYDKIRDDIRRLMLLALQNVSVRGLMSVTALTQSQASTNHGLAVLAVLLEKAERGVAQIWADFEKESDDYIVKYPNDFQMMSVQERLEHIEKLSKMQEVVPSATYRRIIANQITSLVLNQQLSADLRKQIEQEIQDAPSLVVRPADVPKLTEEGVLPREYASKLLNLPADTAEKANKEHAERLARIAQAQVPSNARGNTDGLDMSELEKITSQKGEQ